MDKEKVNMVINIVAPILVSFGALNWGLIGLFEYNIIEEVFSDGGSAYSTTTFAKIIYILIGASAFYMLPFVQKKLKG